MGASDQDFPEPKKEADELAKLMKANVLLVDGSGHYPQAYNPEKAASAIIDFVKRVSPKNTEIIGS